VGCWANDASLADTIPAVQSVLRREGEDVAEMRGQLRAELVREGDYVRAEGPWHLAGVDGQAQL